MSINENLYEISKSLHHIQETGIYDVDKYCCSLLHLTNQLEYFYCHLVPKGSGDCDNTYYRLHDRPKEHQMAYFNIGRGFPKELMDGHWCYVLKDLGYKVLVIPCTSIKKDSKPCHPLFEMDIDIDYCGKKLKSRLQLSDIRSIDMQRLDLRKPFCQVLSDQEKIKQFVEKNLL